MDLKKDDAEERKTSAVTLHEKKLDLKNSRIDEDGSSLSPDVLSDDLLDIDSVQSMMKPEEKNRDHPISDEQQKIVVIIPCFNEETTIGSVIVKARKYADEILVIDDGSADETVKVAKDLGATVISHRMNLGKSAAIKTGFKYALKTDFTFAVTLDGDGQHDAHEIPRMITQLHEKKSDMIVGLRAGKKTEMPLYRRVGKRVLDYATSLGNGGMVTDSQSGFRVFSKKALMGITPKLRGSAFSTESEQLMIASDLGFSVETFPITCKYKSIGDESQTSTKSPTSHGFSVLGYVLWLVAEKRPLLFIGVPGFVFVMMGLFFGIRTLQVYNQTGVFPISYALITSIVLMLGALGLFMGLLLNTLPHIVRKTLNEKEMEDFAVEKDKKDS